MIGRDFLLLKHSCLSRKIVSGVHTLPGGLAVLRFTANINKGGGISRVLICGGNQMYKLRSTGYMWKGRVITSAYTSWNCVRNCYILAANTLACFGHYFYFVALRACQSALDIKGTSNNCGHPPTKSRVHNNSRLYKKSAIKG